MAPKSKKSGRRPVNSPARDRPPLDSPGFEPVLSPKSPRSFRSSAALADRPDFFLAAEQDYDEGGGASNPRSFPYSVKQQCWEKAEKVKGRDPDRWRRDYLGNLVFRKLVGCPGCLCHDYDHILPYSKGGKSTLENCQVLQDATWIYLNSQPTVMSNALLNLEDVASNNNCHIGWMLEESILGVHISQSIRRPIQPQRTCSRFARPISRGHVACESPKVRGTSHSGPLSPKYIISNSRASTEQQWRPEPFPSPSFLR